MTEAGAAGAMSDAGSAGSAVAEGGAPVSEGGSGGSVTVAAGAGGAAGEPTWSEAGAPTSEAGSGGEGGAAVVPGSQWTHCDVIPGDACLDPLLCGQYIVHFGDSGANHVCTFTCRGANAGESAELAAKCKGIGGVCYGDGNQNAMCVPSEPTLATGS